MQKTELFNIIEKADEEYRYICNIELSEKEKKSLRFRRSLYITEDMQAGDIISEKNMRAIRPGLGLAPKFYDKLLGKKVTCDISRGTPVSWSVIEK